MRERLARTIENGGMFLAVTLFMVFLLAPAAFVFRGSIQNISVSLVSSDGGFTLDNYLSILSDGYFVYVFNSLYICAAATVLACTISLFAAYGLSRFRFPGRGFVFGAIMGGQFFPWIILVNPIFIFFARSGLINSHIGLILCYAAFVTPFTIYLLVGYLTTIPKALDEAAIVDGANRFQVIRLVILPIMWPGLVAAATFGFLQSWSEYLLALALITEDGLKTIPLGLYQYFGDVQVDWGAVMAGSVVATVPTLLLFLPLQKKLVSGLTQGATK
ncbi:ABC transporter permease subunit [Roseobacter sp. HKCCD9010]|uniref:carbohydrate ABC transporter permease n=1 Tax=unclassified Roseobacter TaxID=196798 RepID=UPI00149106D5|nr:MULTISPECIES: carbohydrate ABC transporter permease [unclassified Roseobacter]MBF9051150.1 ABC transporter permease subunit [Rhodobacterales bacterium HKCCD4356]NNV12919.1 ABC transporter permease subunit [Roseobacter sp. HKCCD7357]NNV16864.1 ABC transporter permease subunit [Roseobacter sp. HKCCD8768]NNV26504.1 ABC transporter permease subunit [Roseobacter sp. HKCCD8192]NNV30585.1 ABC transporter permease subunit [Roseobacter sp. HKCCD9061]